MTSMMLIWKDPTTRIRYQVGELKVIGGEQYLFKYVNPELNEAVQIGFKNYPTFPDLTKEYSQKGMFQTIVERLPRKKRPDYLNILTRYGLDRNSSDLEILIATRGRTPTDPFEFIQNIEYVPNKPFQVKFDVAGVRHYETYLKNDELVVGSKITLEMDPRNEWDPSAITVRTQNNLVVGYVPKYYSKPISNMLLHKRNYSAKIVRVDLDHDSSDEWIQVYAEVFLKFQDNQRCLR